LLVGGGVAANVELRKRLRKLGKEFGIKVLFPHSKKLTGDNAAMIGIAAYFKYERGEFSKVAEIDRSPNLKLSHSALDSVQYSLNGQ
jgi:N6-L-threonylcarbamoyladenine synthase